MAYSFIYKVEWPLSSSEKNQKKTTEKVLRQLWKKSVKKLNSCPGNPVHRNIMINLLLSKAEY